MRTLRTFISLLLLTANLLGTASADTTPFRIGIFPRQPQDKMLRHFQPLAEWLGRRLGREVVLESAPDFAAFWERVKAGRYALVHYNQYHYIRAHRELGHRVIIKNEELGRSKIRAVFLVPADSHIQHIAQLRGMKILFGGGRGAMVNYILARDLLRARGLHEGDYLESFARTPIDAINALYYGQAEAAGAGDTLIRLQHTPWSNTPNALRVIALSTPIAQLPWAVAAWVPDSLAERIRNALLALNDDPAGRVVLEQAHLTGLRPASDAEYDAVRRIVARVLGEHY